MSMKYLQEAENYERSVNPRSIIQRALKAIHDRLWFAKRNTTATAGAPTTGTWEVDELYRDKDYVVWRCTEAGMPGTWVEEAGGFGAGVPFGRWDFNGITTTHTTRKAYYGSTANLVSPTPAGLISNGTQYSDSNYQTIWFKDAEGVAVNPGANIPYQIFAFRIGPQPDATKITVKATCQVIGNNTASLTAWVSTGSNTWVQAADKTAQGNAWEDLSGDIPSEIDIASCIDGDGWLYFYVTTDAGRYIRVDYVALDIENVAAPNGEAGAVGARGAAGEGGKPVGRFDFNGATREHAGRKLWWGYATENLYDPRQRTPEYILENFSKMELYSPSQAISPSYSQIYSPTGGQSAFGVSAAPSAAPYWMAKITTNYVGLGDGIRFGFVAGSSFSDPAVLFVFNRTTDSWEQLGSVKTDAGPFETLVFTRSTVSDYLTSDGSVYVLMMAADFTYPPSAIIYIDYLWVDLIGCPSENGEAGPQGYPTARFDFNGITPSHVSRLAIRGYVSDPLYTSLSDLLAAGSSLTAQELNGLWYEDGTVTGFATASGVPYYVFGFRTGNQAQAKTIRGLVTAALGEGQSGALELRVWGGDVYRWVPLCSKTFSPAYSWENFNGDPRFFLPSIVNDGWIHLLLAPTSGPAGIRVDYVGFELANAASPQGEAGPSGNGTAGADGKPVGRWDFNGITAAHSSRKVWAYHETYGIGVTPPTIPDSAVALSNSVIEKLWSLDSTTGCAVTDFDGKPPGLLFRIRVNQQPDATKFKVTVNALGQCSIGPLSVALWNGSLWDEICYVPSENAFRLVSGERNSSSFDLSTYIDSNGDVWIAVYYGVFVSPQLIDVDYIALDIENAAAPNGEAGPGMGGLGSLATNAIPKWDGSEMVDSGATSASDGLLNHFNYGGYGEFLSYGTTVDAQVELTADNQDINSSTYGFFRLSSDNSTAENRTFVLANGVSYSQHLLIRWEGENAGQLINSGNVILSADWIPSDGNMISLVWDSAAAKWREQWRYPAVASVDEAADYEWTGDHTWSESGYNLKAFTSSGGCSLSGWMGTGAVGDGFGFLFAPANNGDPGENAVPYIFDTFSAITTAGYKLASFRNNGVEKAYIDKDGNFSGMLLSASEPAGSKLYSNQNLR